MSGVRPTRAARAGRAVVVALALLWSLGPVAYGVVLAVRPYGEVTRDPLGLPTTLDLSAFATALRDEADGGFGLGRFVLNSLGVALGTVLLSIAVCVLGAYAAARLRYRGRAVTNGIILAVYLFPGIVLAVPKFVVLARLGLTSSLAGLLVVYVAATVPVALYMMRNFFLALPASVEEAAIMDGCTLGQLLVRVVLPIAVPGVVATAIYVFMIAWNEYFYALLFLVQRRELWTAPLGIAQLGDFQVPVTVLLAGSIAVTVPVVVIFFLAQRYIVSGLVQGAER
ncbi:carbohydrate ABC transporter permease [Promicromonospora citrea]|uniref:Transporter n=1 Tax=Promicromonospora citrea TaxID=43677 RepID=A0A8H9GHV1_9MICO|nr:carbohydrate ABC transporter permease [Promicromonospora citrea]NNH52819.1 carbohydrate ABC transporter permease [Promicromonospora citrea]GGM28041.1 transporter [Promicromonospora citrea]